MKKIIILSLIATFVSVFSANAQENTYSIVIKMANGTTFTIGPNEVENITFNDGQVTVSGQNIEEMAARINYLEKVLNETARIDDLEKVRYESEAKLQVLESKVERLHEDLLTRIADLESKVSFLFERWVPELQGRIEALEQIVGTVKTTRPSVKKMKNRGE